MSQFLNLGFWGASAYYGVSLITRGFWAVFLLFVVLAIVSKLVLRFKNKSLPPTWGRALRKASKMFGYLGVVGLALMFFNYEDIPYLASRFVHALWAVGAVAWIIYIAVHVWRRLPEDRAAGQQNAAVNQYIPKY